mgnify:CR=1 FL=1
MNWILVVIGILNIVVFSWRIKKVRTADLGNISFVGLGVGALIMGLLGLFGLI